jgi:MFS family permease
MATLLMQAPAGALIDASRHKKWIIALAALLLGLGCICIVAALNILWAVVAQVIIGLATSFVPACIAALALGIVGRGRAVPSDRSERGVQPWRKISLSRCLSVSLVPGSVWTGFSTPARFARSRPLAALLLVRSRDIDDEAARESDDVDAAEDVQMRTTQQAELDSSNPKFVPWGTTGF